VEFEVNSPDYKGNQPEGEAELWVIPQAGDLGAFRSDSPRLVHELNPDGSQELLVLMDRSDPLVLLDLEYVDGSRATRVLQPDSTALFMGFGRDELPGLASCRIIVSGERTNHLLCSHPAASGEADWDLQPGQRSGLNPGARLEWNLQMKDQPIGPFFFWSIYTEGAGDLLSGWMAAQSSNREAMLHRKDANIVSLGDWLPLHDPLEDSSPQEMALAPPGTPRHTDPLMLLGLYPELARSPGQPVSATLQAGLSEGSGLNLPVTLPVLAGKWQLAVFNPSPETGIQWRTWPLSTELPVRTSINGPSVIRRGDQVQAVLQVENTTRRPEPLRFVVESDSILEAGPLGVSERTFAPGEKGGIVVPVTAAESGRGIINTIAEGRLSFSEAALASYVEQPASRPAVQAFLVRPGESNWQEQVSLSDWQSGRVIVTSGLGSVLSEVWPLIHDREVSSEPLLAALGDWAFAQVHDRHGISSSLEVRAVEVLEEELERYASSGGWAWTPGHGPDPWLTALVLWSLETFAGLPSGAFPDYQVAARGYLESILINEDIDDENRLFALRALAVPALRDPRIRPTRIQAKSFLDFLHQRSELANAELASLLLIARAYHFSEEVRLLLGELKTRFQSSTAVSVGSFWSNSLVYLALAENSGEAAIRFQILGKELDHLTRMGPNRSWEQFGGYMNLLAAFLWEGDFTIEGEATVTIGLSEPVQVSLRPHGQNQGVFRSSLEADTIAAGRVPVHVDSTGADNPVFVVLMGERGPQGRLPAFPEQSRRQYREYLEPTLLAGARLQVVPYSPDQPLSPGDTLQIHQSLYVESPAALAEFVFPVPAGAVLAADAIQHSFESSDPDLQVSPPNISVLDRPDSLRKVVRMEPFVPGRHEFILSYRILWGGDYAFPAASLHLPRSGQSYELGTGQRLSVAPDID
jgi:hypothetical protein